MRDEMPPPVISKASRFIVFLAFAAMCIGSLGIFTWSVVLPSLISGVPAKTFTWGYLFGFEAFLFGVLSWLGIGIFRKFNTHLSQSGITYPTIHGPQTLEWSQVQKVKQQGHEVRLSGNGRSITINAYCYSTPKAVGQFVAKCLPAHVLNSSAA